jgi:hypothetical protein
MISDILRIASWFVQASTNSLARIDPINDPSIRYSSKKDGEKLIYK